MKLPATQLASMFSYPNTIVHHHPLYPRIFQKNKDIVKMAETEAQLYFKDITFSWHCRPELILWQYLT